MITKAVRNALVAAINDATECKVAKHDGRDPFPMPEGVLLWGGRWSRSECGCGFIER